MSTLIETGLHSPQRLFNNSLKSITSQKYECNLFVFGQERILLARRAFITKHCQEHAKRKKTRTRSQYHPHTHAQGSSCKVQQWWLPDKIKVNSLLSLSALFTPRPWHSSTTTSFAILLPLKAMIQKYFIIEASFHRLIVIFSNIFTLKYNQK